MVVASHFRHFFLVLFSCCLVNRAGAQSPSYLNESLYLEYFSTLKNGNLLIRLSDRAAIREKLVKYGENEKLKKFDAALQAEYAEIFNAFKKHYDFGKVYFFLRSETAFLTSDKLPEMQFFDVNGQKVNANQIDVKSYLIGEFSRMERRTRGPLIQSKEDLEKGDFKTSFSAFVIRDKNSRLIQKSYYLFVRSFLGSKSASVKKLNKRLQRNLILMNSSLQREELLNTHV